MRFIRAEYSRLKIWLLLMAAFTVIGVASGAAVLFLSLNQLAKDARQELTTLANVVALSIDGDKHAELTRPDQTASETYRKLNEQLAQAKQRIPSARYIYTLKPTEAGYVFVLDPTPPGDHDGDGVDDKSYLLDPYPEVPPAAKLAYQTASAQVDSGITVDRWGTFISGYAPIFNSKGQVVGIVGVDRLASDLKDQQWMYVRAAILTTLFVIILGGLLAYSLTRPLDNKRLKTSSIVAALVKLNRRAYVLELLLLSMAVGVFFFAYQSYQTHASSQRAMNESISRVRQLDQLATAFTRELATPELHLRDLMEDASDSGVDWVHARLAAAGLPGRNLREQATRIHADLQNEIRRELRSQEALHRRAIENNDALLGIFVVAAVMALGALVLIRNSVSLHEDLTAARRDSKRHQFAYENLVAHLPVGLYLYRQGEITYANAAWDTAFGYGGVGTRTEALAEALGPAERERFFSSLNEAQDFGETFETQFKCTSPSGDVRILETQAIPVMSDGVLEYLLGFTIDVTHKMRTQQMIETKSREVLTKNRMLSQAISDLEANFEATVQTLVKAVEAKDPYTAGHSERVSKYSVMIGEKMNLSQRALKALELGTLLHDIGKIGIPDEVLTKPEKLSQEEYDLVKRHAELGASMIENIPMFKDCVPIVRWHHERLDGSGYPDRLFGREIPVLVRIAAVADVFDALTSNRAYRFAKGEAEALEILRKEAEEGTLDVKIVELLAEIVEREGTLWNSSIERAA